MNTPTDVANQALDAVASTVMLGDLEEGTRQANLCLRAYRQCLMQLLRAVHWDFARKQVPLVLLGDATGQTPNVGTVVTWPWYYMYEYPIDCMKARFVPWIGISNPGAPTGNIVPVNNGVPLMLGLDQNSKGARLRPARFLVGTSTDYPPPPGQVTWEVQGVSPQARTVVLTNVKCATMVYTALTLYPSLWDAQFRAAFVAYLASEIALSIWAEKDRNFGLKLRAEQVMIAKAKVIQARITDGNEGGPTTNDISVSWMRDRNAGGGAFGWWGGRGNGEGVGYGSCGYDSLTLADGAVF